MTRNMQADQIRIRARRSVREIGVAMALTLAGVIFLLMATIQGGSSKTASIAPEAGLENRAN